MNLGKIKTQEQRFQAACRAEAARLAKLAKAKCQGENKVKDKQTLIRIWQEIRDIEEDDLTQAEKNILRLLRDSTIAPVMEEYN